MRLQTSTLIACCFALPVFGCVASAVPVRHAEPEQLSALPESQAIALIDDCLAQARLTPKPGWAVQLPQHAGDLSVDIRVGVAPVGIEWVSQADREQYGRTLPPPDPSGQLRVMQAKDGALILLLDQASYRFERSGPQAWVASRDLDSTEDRLKRDVQDFIAYVKSQYPL